MRAVVNCRVCELAIALQLLVVTICKCSVNPITNPNPVYSHFITSQYTCIRFESFGVTKINKILLGSPSHEFGVNAD
jgi:hypothetical protein